MANVHDSLEEWQGSRDLPATQKESRSQHKQMTATQYIPDTEEIINASWSNFQHDCAAAFKSSERSPLPPALSAKDLPGGRIQELNVCRMKRIDLYSADNDNDSVPGSISDTENWLNWNSDLDNPNDSEVDCEADDESDIDPDSGIRTSESPEHWVEIAAHDVPGLNWPTPRSMRRAQNGVDDCQRNGNESNKGNKKKYDRIGQYVSTRVYMLLDQEFHL